MLVALLLANLINFILQEPLYQNLLSSIQSSLQRKTPEETETEYVKNPEFSTFELSEKWEEVNGVQTQRANRPQQRNGV